ncbi:MAG: hypothetical protein LBV16_02660 [Elusimicrobiota bacterium]|jgi:hypothetical protein|nr:hypothetical protein [Elusimicrobiota bacterium]
MKDIILTIIYIPCMLISACAGLVLSITAAAFIGDKKTIDSFIMRILGLVPLFIAGLGFCAMSLYGVYKAIARLF